MMRALLIAVMASALCATAASAQLVRAPQTALRTSAQALQQTTDRRWAEVFARDAEFMRAVRAATTAEIAARRARKEDVSGLQTELDQLNADMSMSFNMQYLSLQQTMQVQSRRFTLLSNIMKTKHDTVRNSISNVR